MSSTIEAAKRALEKTPGGSDPESPHKKQASAEEEEGQRAAMEGDAQHETKKIGDEEKDMKQMMKQMMGMMGNSNTKMDGVTTKVDDAVKIAKEAKDKVILMGAKITTIETDMGEMRKQFKDKEQGMAEWRFNMGVKIEQAAYKDAMENEGDINTGKQDKDSVIYAKITEIEKNIAKMMEPIGTKGASSTSQNGYLYNDIMAQTIVFGGFSREGDGQDEIEWLEKKLKEKQTDPLDSIYFKGDEFKGLLFVKFCNAEVASKAIDIISKSKLAYGDGDISCKPEAPVEIRAVRSLLLGLRWQLNK